MEMLVLFTRHDTIGHIMKNTKPYQEKLEAEKKTLEEELSDIARQNEETGKWEAIPDQDLLGQIDENDAADRFEDFEERSAMVGTLQSRLQDVEDALKKIENGTYGICEISGEEIETERLDANPAARTSKKYING